MKGEHLPFEVHGQREDTLLNHRWGELCQCSILTISNGSINVKDCKLILDVSFSFH